MLAKILFAVTMAISSLAGTTVDPIGVDAIAFGDHYVHVDETGRMGMWEESNGHPGLQTKAIVMTLAGVPVTAVEPDTRVLV